MKLRLFFLLYLVLNSLPFFVLDYKTTLFLHNPFLQILELNLLLISLPFFWGAELFLFLYLFSKFENKILKGLIFILSFLFNFVIIINWFYYENVGLFLETSSLDLLKFFGDNNLTSLVSPKEIFILLASIVFSLFVSSLKYLISKKASLKVLKSNLKANLVILGLVIAAAHLFFGRAAYSQRAEFLLRYLSPRYSFFYNKVFLSSKPGFKKLPLAELNLETLKPLTNPSKLNKPKNVILIIVEALRYDAFLEAMPRVLEKVSKHGSLKKGLSAGVDTDYARTTIISGQYPLRSLSRDFKENMNYPVMTIYERFKKMGYQTLQFSEEFTFTKYLTDSWGLDESFDSKSYFNDELIKYVNPKFLKTYPGRGLPSFIVDSAYVDHLLDFSSNSKSPFFANIYFYASHFPYDFLPDFMGEPKVPHPELPDNYSFFNYDSSHKEIMETRYFNTVDFLDREISKLINVLEERGELENTIIFITGDHGEAFHDPSGVTHGREILPQIVEVPFAFISKDKTFDFGANCVPSHVDMYASIFDSLGAELPIENQGVSFFDNETCQGTPKFSVSQGFEFQTGMLLEEVFLVKDSKTSKYFKQDDRQMVEVEEGSYQKEKKCLEDFRNRQISYYQLESKDLKKYAPPKFKNCL